jgi:hypothetical protein
MAGDPGSPGASAPGAGAPATGGGQGRGGAVRVAVYVVDDDQRAAAEAALGDVTVFANVVEGTVDEHALPGLADAGLVVERLPDPGPPPPPPWAPDESVVDLLAEEARYGPLPTEPGDEAADLASDDRPGDDFFSIQMTGPITQDQRLELDALGVDIAAFEPPSSYRTYLTRDQHARVRALPYVTAIRPYPVEEKLSPELVDVVEEEAASPEAEPATRAFDCLLHRERDLPAVRDLIEGTGRASVVDTSNLRVRFTAPADLALLGQLACRPEIRKLAVYRPPPTLGGLAGAAP